MAPEEFIKEILVKRMDVRHICVGTDFRFGRNREGDIHTLERFQDTYHYSLDIVPKLTLDDETISSTLVRNLMEMGNLSRRGASWQRIGKDNEYAYCKPPAGR